MFQAALVMGAIVERWPIRWVDSLISLMEVNEGVKKWIRVVFGSERSVDPDQAVKGSF